MKAFKKYAPFFALRFFLLGIFTIIVIVVVALARGYRFNFQSNSITSTGIINISSFPEASKILINNELRGVTDSNVTLPYGVYTIEIQKDGYSTWKKTINLQGEIVMSLQARLFSKNPSLSPMTNLGISRVIPIGFTDKYILVTNSDSSEENGIQLFEPGKKTLGSIFPPSTLLLTKERIPQQLDINSLELDYAPNFKQAIVTFATKTDDLTNSDEREKTSYLISLEDENTELFDVTTSRENIISAWNEEINQEMLKILEALPKQIRSIAQESMLVVSLSPGEKKLMYVAKKDMTIPLVISPSLIGSNQTEEQREIILGNLYIYDIKEDKNYQVDYFSEVVNQVVENTNYTIEPQIESVATTESDIKEYLVWDKNVSEIIRDEIVWYPTSDYIGKKGQSQIDMIGYDGTNLVTVYAGPFDASFFGFDSNWNLMILTNLNPDNNEFGDLYSVGII